MAGVCPLCESCVAEGYLVFNIFFLLHLLLLKTALARFSQWELGQGWGPGWIQPPPGHGEAEKQPA